MNRIAIAAAMLLASMTAHAELWVTSASGKDGIAFSAVDTKTLVLNDGLRIAWVYWVSSTKDGNVKSVSAFRSNWNCRTREVAIREWSEYDPARINVTNQGRSQEPFESPAPNTNSYSVMEFVCDLDPATKQPRENGDFYRMEGDNISFVVEDARKFFRYWADEQAKAKP